MNRFHYMSDLHIEFAMPKASDLLVSGENLILAGDITLLACLDPTKTDAQSRKLRDRTLKFFEIMQENFKRVFYLTGNHESYHGDINDQTRLVKDHLPGVIHLNDSSYEFEDGTVIMGGTLWTDMNRGNPMTMMMIESGMNDFRYIDNGDQPFIALDATVRHAATKSFLKNELERYRDRNVVVATHHSPSYRGNGAEHTSSSLTDGYCSEMEDFIIAHPQIKYWVFGHTHVQMSFKVGETTLVSNARGYEGYEMSATKFKSDRYFEV